MNIQAMRMFVATLVGQLLVRLVAATPSVAEGFASVYPLLIDAGHPAITSFAVVQTVVQTVVVAAVIVGYQKVAEWLGDRWPDVEKWMFGSSSRPHYEPLYAA